MLKTTNIETEEVVKVPSLFDFLTDICYEKKGTLLTDASKSNWSTFIILRFLSMSPDLVKIVDFLNKYQNTYTKEEMYKVLVAIVPKKRRFLKYQGAKSKAEKINEELIEKMTEYLAISEKTAKEYIPFLSEELKEGFLESYGGKIRLKK